MNIAVNNDDPKSIHNLLVTGFLASSLDAEFIAKAFFLPKEILHSAVWKVEPIKICTGVEWRQAEKFLRKQPHTTITLEPSSEEIIAAARNLGVSVRRHAITGETFVVVRLWYGGDQHQTFSPRKTVTVSSKHPVASNDRIHSS